MNPSQPQFESIEQPARAESALHVFFALSLDLFCIRGQDGYFKQLSPSWENLLGWTYSELVGTPWTSFVHPDDVEVSVNAETRCSQENIVVYENRYRHKDGTYRWLSWRVSQQQDGFFYAVGKDITAVKQSEDALNGKQTESNLRESERRFRAVFNQTFQFSSLLTLDGTVLEDNQTALDFCQIERKDIVGRRFWEMPCWTISPETQERLRRAIASAAAGNVVRYEEDILAPDGIVVTIDFSLKPLKDETGQMELLIAEGRDLTERKRIEQNLQQAVAELTEWQNRYEAAAQINGLLLYEWNCQTEEIIWGHNVEQVFGYPREELTGSIEQWMELFHPDDLEKVIQELNRVITTKEPLHIEYRMRQKDGTYITLEDKGQFYPDSNGNLNRMVGFVANITERKRTEEALRERESEERWQLALRGNNDSIWDLNLKTNQCFHSPRWREMLGYEEHEASNDWDDWETRIHPDDLGRVMKIRQEHLQRKTPHYIAEYRIRCKDGSYKWILSRAQAMWDEAGNPVRMVGSHTDITERKRTEEALRESEERWQLALRGNNDGIWDLDIKNNRVFYSARWKEMLGYEDDEIPNASDQWTKRVHPDDIGWVTQLCQDHVQGKTPYFIAEYRMRCKDGSYKWILDRGHALRDEAGNLVRIIGSHTDITERKQAEEALRESETQYRTLVANIPGVVYRCAHTQEWQGMFISDGIEDLCGYPASDFAPGGTRNFASIIYPEDVEKVDQVVEAAITERQPFTLDYRIVHTDGSLRWVYDKGEGIFGEQGELLWLDGVIFDISDRKQAEETLQQVLLELEKRVEERTAELTKANDQLRSQIAERRRTEAALRQSEKQFRQVFEESPIGMALCSPERGFISVNRAYIEMLGYTESELSSLSFRDITHPEDLELEIPYLERAIKGETDGYQLEKRYLKKNQEILWVNLTCVLLRDEAGEMLYCLGMVEDITERKQAEEALQQSEARYRAIVEDQTELICRFKPDGTLTFVNDAYSRYFSKDRSELIGHSFLLVIPEEDREFLTQSFSLSDEQPIITYEHRVILPSGEIRWQQWTDRAVMFDEQGKVIEFQGVGRDITELKQAEAEIRKALEKERELSELRSGFVSLVSHEFRTPLTTIQSSAELLERYGNRFSDEKKQIHLTRILSAVKRMTQLLEDILTIGKAEAGKLQFEPSPMDLVAFCREIVESMQISARPHYTINFVTQGDGSDAQMDEKLLGHILTNLLSNGIKYSPRGDTVQFDLICRDSWAIFRIQDSGIGIPQEDLEKLFESFQRASNVGTIPGTGLGLAIVQKCVNLHGGKITVESEVGEGTTFTVTLPLRYS